MPPKFNIPVNPKEQELREIKARQLVRKAENSKKVTMDDIYQAQMDILENQARQENQLNKLLARQ